MTLSDLVGALVAPDHFEGGDLLPLDVVFDTSGRSNLYLLSVYYSSDDGKIHIDIGDDDDD